MHHLGPLSAAKQYLAATGNSTWLFWWWFLHTSTVDRIDYSMTLQRHR